ncbi:outer membrane beta-barrel family protein [soil metagenome]
MHFYPGILCGIFLFFAITASFCQGTIQGNVKNEMGQPIAFANILLLNKADSSLIKGIVCDESGKYNLSQITKGSYLISAHMLGFQTFFSSPVSVEVNNNQIMEFILAEEVSELSEVLVSAQKPLFEQQMGKLVVNVSSSIISSGSTVLEVLSRTPGILVNPQNNSITMNGKEGVMVMLNGKLVRLPLNVVVQMLSGMNADQVSTIEIINNPPARYEAEGNAGLINIISKENLEMGTNGSFSGNFGTSFDKRTLERFGGSMNINHRGRKVSFYLNAAARREHFLALFTNSRTINPNGVEIGSVSEFERDFMVWTLNGQGGFEITLNANTTIGGQLTGISTKQDQVAFGHTDIIQSNLMNTRINVKDLERNHWWGYGSNLYFTHKFQKGGLMTFDLDYLYYFHNNPHDYRFNYSFYPEQSEEEELLVNDKHTPIHIRVAKSDYQQRLNEKLSMEMGLKGTLSDIANKIEAQRFINNDWSIDPELSQHVLMQENIGAAYLSFDADPDPKTKIQAGLRFEQTYTHLENFTGEPILERNYGNLFPNFSFSREINDDHKIMLSYGRRISRPTYSDLAPFVTFFDPLNLVIGNMELLPSLSHSFQTNFQFKKSYSINFDITQIKNLIGWDILVFPDKNVQLIQKNNFDNSRNISLSLNAPNNFETWWEGNSSIQAVHQKVHSISQNTPLRRTMKYIHINSSQTFRLGNGFSAEVSGFYISPQLQGLLTQKSYGALNLGFQKELNNNKGSFKLSGEDILWTNRFAFENNNSQIGFESNLAILLTSRLIRLTYSRNFGRSGIKSVKKAAGSEEERNRVQ